MLLNFNEYTGKAVECIDINPYRLKILTESKENILKNFAPESIHETIFRIIRSTSSFTFCEEEYNVLRTCFGDGTEVGLSNSMRKNISAYYDSLRTNDNLIHLFSIIGEFCFIRKQYKMESFSLSDAPHIFKLDGDIVKIIQKTEYNQW